MGSFKRINRCPICVSLAEVVETEGTDGGHGAGRWPAFFLRCTNKDCAITIPTYPLKYPSGDKLIDLDAAIDHWNGLWDQKKTAADVPEHERLQLGEPTRWSLWRHYKGGQYQVLFMATHTETEERMVVYTSANPDNHQVWTRPFSMWYEDVGGQPRFQKVP